MRITTWNVNSVRARLQRVLDWIDRNEPDLLCLQELKCTDDQFPREAFEARGYHCTVMGQKSWNGVAILSRSPPTKVERGLPWPQNDEARGLSVVVDGLRIVDLYVINGREVGHEQYARKLRFLDDLRSWLDQHGDPGELLCVCGDFNIAPDDRDVYDPVAWKEAILCSSPERQRLQALVDWGLVDSFRQFDDRPGQYSWWDMRTRGFERGQGLRIDHLLVTEGLLEACQGCEIDVDERALVHPSEKPSDHAPVSLLLED